MDLELAGCAAIAGGSSSGMGLAIARALAAEGCDVALFARREEPLATEAHRIETDFPGVRALPVTGDSTDPEALQRVVAEALGRFDRLDIVVNNTGGPPAGDFGDFDDDAWQDGYELSVLSAIRLTRNALPALRKSGRGRVVNITSSTVKELADSLLLANALRPGVVGWAKHLSREEGPNGITVNCIAPGYIDTDRLKYLYSLADDPEASRRADAAAIPARRFGEAEEVGATVAFLCSRRADYISGITVLVDGGLARGLLS
jgi:3-oxoacyl-[acyl-carrier protein] reductase